jgi:hypothetical protein
MTWESQPAFDARMAERRATPTPPTPLRCWYHCAAIGNYREVLKEHASLCESVGLHPTACVVGGTQADADWVATIWPVAYYSPRVTEYEIPTLQKLWEWCRENPTGSVLYFHTKGVSFPNDAGKSAWRRLMDHYLIRDWKANLDRLAVADMVGVDWQDSPQFPHFSGNYWMARADWINRLESPSEYRARGGPVFAQNPWDRMCAELWLGSRRYHHIESLACRNENLWTGTRAAELLEQALQTNKLRFHVVAPPYVHYYAGVRCLYRLAGLLLNRGYHTTIGAAGSDPNAVVIYPETVSGNPLNASRVVRWDLNKSRQEYPGGDLVFSYNRFFLPYSTAQPENLLTIWPIEPFFCPPSVEQRDVTLWYSGKTPPDDRIDVQGMTAITRGYDCWPPTRQELAFLLQRSKVLYTFDTTTALAEEARLCGCPVVVMEPKTETTNTLPINGEFPSELGQEGFLRFSEATPEAIEQARGETRLLPGRLPEILDQERRHVDRFINILLQVNSSVRVSSVK